MALPPHCDFVNRFVLGDLIYGTTYDRGDYIAAATGKLNSPGAKVTIDRMTSALDTTLRGWGEYAGKINQQQFEALPQSAQSFLMYAQQCGPLWAKMRGNNVNQYTKHDVAKAMPGLGNTMKWSSAYMRAKCKAGIQFVLDSGYTVHFALDSLWSAEKMETIARKETDQPWHTGSELRWLYKHRGNAKVASKVAFYVNGSARQAPWDEWPNSWANYGATRMEKVPEDFRK
jgi:hypothetical protein